MQKLKTEYKITIRIKVDAKLNFNFHSNNKISKPSLKINALLRNVRYLTLSEKVILTNSF